MSKNNDYTIILLGDSEVGKATLFKKISSGIFTDKNISTIGIDKKTLSFKDIEVEIKGKKQKEDFNIILYDTAGQERYRAITKNYFQGKDMVFMIYDISSRRSFIDIESWLESLKEVLSSWEKGNYLIFLFGNKVDLIDNKEKPREVEEEEAMKLCEDNNIIWGGEKSFLNSSKDQLTEMILNCWKDYVHKFGIKEEIILQKKIEGEKFYRKKKKKKNICIK